MSRNLKQAQAPAFKNDTNVEVSDEIEGMLFAMQLFYPHKHAINLSNQENIIYDFMRLIRGKFYDLGNKNKNADNDAIRIPNDN